MTTTLDIVDTAVKIGLGATIAGLSAYVIGRQKHNQEIENKDRDEQKSLSRELALTVEKIESSLQECAFEFHNQNIELSKKSVVNAGDHLCTASALSNLLGSSTLVEELRKVSEHLEWIYHELKSDSPKESEMEGRVLEIVEIKAKMYPEISKFYKTKTS
ncbi:hypothetical protein [Pelagicoccus sp. SDUM812005]|uniref:hypothetical protein n=1 Tax=Pelagicoccus sp. SDUM812005 TaxID=3041257 RepID=UPI00280EA06B|nr:hypothetical protein [Pelagicoccus sp. SDUM812005]MDQ8182584.1 hypothetical protein [Pelagicoccus sp. SDUM812005]